MALKRIVTNLEEVDAALRGLYTKQADGSFALEIEGIEDTAGLKKALQAERDGRSAEKAELAALRKQIEGLDPEKARAAMEKLQQIEERKLIEAGEVDKVIAARTQALQADHANQIKTFQQQLQERDELLGKTTGQLRELTLTGAIRELAVKKGVKASAIADAIGRLTVFGVGGKDGQPGIKWDLKDGKVVALRGDEVVYGKDATQPMSLGEGFDLLSDEAKHLFEPSQGGGSTGAPGTTNGRDVHLTREQASNTEIYRQAREQAAKAGGQVIVPPIA